MEGDVNHMNVEFERCMEFLARMIEKYGNEICMEPFSFWGIETEKFSCDLQKQKARIVDYVRKFLSLTNMKMKAII